MKRYYSKFRIMLMTFALGLASVFMLNGSLQFSDEVLINLPETKSENVLIVFPLCRSEMPYAVGGHDWMPPPDWIRKIKTESEVCKEINQKKLNLQLIRLK
ncbi:hypothetical protein BH20ACI1_BH20ACI1_14090 [soil metagenome]